MSDRLNDTTSGAANKGHETAHHAASSSPTASDIFAGERKNISKPEAKPDTKPDTKPDSKPEVKPDAKPDVNAADRPRLLYLQTTLANFLPVVDTDLKLSKSPDAVALQQKQLAAESARHEFGPATKEAYGNYVKWLQDKTLPETRRDLKYVGLPERDSAPGAVSAPAHDLHLDPRKLPGDAELTTLDGAMRWAQQADTRIDVAKREILKQVDENYTSTVNNLGLPHGWLMDIDNDHERWRSTVGPLINNALTARSNIEILDELHQAGSSVSVESLLHKGAGITRDGNGSINGIHLNLPQGWDLTNADNGSRARALAQFVGESGGALAGAMPDLSAVREDVAKSLSWSDTELKDTQGRFDKDGHLLGLIKKGDMVKAGEHAEDINLLKSRYSTEEKDGKIILHQSVQAQSVPWWGYQNLIGVSDVGKPVEITRSLNPGDNVVMRTAGGYEVKQARDLESYRDWHMASYYGEKTLMGALDAGLLIKGGLEAKAAFAATGDVGLRMAATGGVEVTSRQLTLQAARGGLNMTIGALGLINNAGARESSVGQTVNTARSLYFLGGAATSLGSVGMRATRSLMGSAEATPLYSAQLHGLGDATSAASRAYNVVNRSFVASEYGFVPLLGADVKNSIARLNNDKNRHVVRAAEIAAESDPSK
jgi:hypothetical protein